MQFDERLRGGIRVDAVIRPRGQLSQNRDLTQKWARWPIHAGSRHSDPDTPHYRLADAPQLAEQDMAFVQRGNQG